MLSYDMLICIYLSTLFKPNDNFTIKATRKNLNRSFSSYPSVKNPVFAKNYKISTEKVSKSISLGEYKF